MIEGILDRLLEEYTMREIQKMNIQWQFKEGANKGSVSLGSLSFVWKRSYEIERSRV